MDKKTILAVVLSVVIITASFLIQSMFFPTTIPQPKPAPQVSAPATPGTPAAPGAPGAPAAPGAPVQPLTGAPAPVVGQLGPATVATAQPPVKDVKVSTTVFDATFSTRGGVLTSLKLKAFKERNGSPVEMVLSGDTGVYPFRLFLDGYDTGNDAFTQEPVAQSDRVELSRAYLFRRSDGKDVVVNVKKTFRFQPSDYMMEYRVTLESADREQLPIQAYSFAFGPQIGPAFKKLDGNADYRHLIYYADGKRKDYTGKVKLGPKAIDDRSGWAAVEGKYFIVTGISYVSDPNAYQVGFDTTPQTGLLERAQDSLTYRRVVGRSASLDEGYKFYVGPKKRDILSRYDDKEKNEWRESGLQLDEAVATSFWGWLSDALKWVLETLYKVVPNWGVAIILLTILVKAAFWPLTQKSYESTSKMQALGPKLNDLRAKYKDNPQKMNQETAALYKREGVNPLGGCLPLLLQMPIFFALYRLFNDYFELRGAAFIPGWIPDLSGPEQFLTMPFALPFIGDSLNLLPFIMTGMTFLQQLVTQTPGTQPQGQMKFLLYGMPLFFFFIMYNMPSGLLLYWTVQSLLSFVQQFAINQQRARSQARTGDKR